MELRASLKGALWYERCCQQWFNEPHLGATKSHSDHIRHMNVKAKGSFQKSVFYEPASSAADERE